MSQCVYEDYFNPFPNKGSMMLEKGLDNDKGIDVNNDDTVIDATDIQHKSSKQQSEQRKGNEEFEGRSGTNIQQDSEIKNASHHSSKVLTLSSNNNRNWTSAAAAVYKNMLAKRKNMFHWRKSQC